MKVKTKKGLGLFFIIVVVVAGSYGLYFNYRKDVPRIIKPLPNVLMFNNGTLVETAEDWTLRRLEIKDLLLDIEYGTIPEHPEKVVASLIASSILENATYYSVLLTCVRNESLSTNFSFSVDLFVPLDISEPLPVVIKVAPDGTGTQVPINHTMVNRGYIFACYSHTDLDPDTSGYDEVGPAQAAYPEYSWGSLGVWAWGAMRVADFLLNETWAQHSLDFGKVNASSLIVTGHSRRGKTALLAGALDERFTMVVPNGSGCGGAGSFLVQGPGAESLNSITSELRYKSWFKADFGEYGNKEKNLPFDQHFLRSLVAPRIILSTDGLSDYWANPTGTQAMYEATGSVYALLNLIQNNAIHFREGGHGFLLEDFHILLDCADCLLFGKNVSSDFYTTPFDLNLE